MDGASHEPGPGDTRPLPPTSPADRTNPAGVGRARTAAVRTRTAAQATGRWTGGTARATRARIRKVTHAQGAGASGLAKLIELHAVSAAGDALIAVSLAGTLFFAVPTGEARGKVAIYLLVTMAPFVLVAPVIGPVLDRFRHGRRGAIAGSFALRGFLAWVLADAVAGGGIELYPAAFGVLIGSKAYVLSRSACVPRVLPSQISLVRANSRISLAGVAGVALATPVAAGLAAIGPEWSLRVAFLVFVLGTILSAMLPRGIDATAGEVDANVLSADQGRDLPLETGSRDPAEAWADRWAPSPLPDRSAAGADQTLHARSDPNADAEPAPVPEPGPVPERISRRPRLGNVGAAVVMGLRANVALRAMTGFLTIFMLFLVRDQPLGGLSSELSVGALGLAVVLGSLVGSMLGNRFRELAPEPIIVGVLALAALTALVTAMFYSVGTALVVGAVAALAQQLGKLAMDAQIQRDVPERVRTSAFARTETAVQLAWVLGGGLGIALPLNPVLGFTVVAAGLLATSLVIGRSFVVLVRAGRTSRPRPA